MCFCDDKYFKLTNIRTGEEKLYKRADSITRRFETCKHCVFMYLEHGYHFVQNGNYYKVSVNSHPECEQVRRELAQKTGVHLRTIPDELRHLLPEHRR